MSAEDRAALRLPADLFEAVLRAARETAREEVRAALDARNAMAPRDALITPEGVVTLNTVNGFRVPETVAGVPV